jgi:hypothetical protein
MRLPRLNVLRTLAALAIAFGSPGVEVSHALAHDHEHDTEHSQPASHHVDASVEPSDHAADHAHQEISEALRIRADLPDFVAVEAAVTGVDLTATSIRVAVRASDSRLIGDRSTGPPPRLRAPPTE